MKNSKTRDGMIVQISNSWVQGFFRLKIARINTYENLNLTEDEVLDIFPYISNKPILSTEKISVRRNGKENSFGIKISLKFFHFFLQPGPELQEKESEDYLALSKIQKKKDPSELTQALRRIIGLNKGSERFITQLLIDEETRILSREGSPQVTVIFQKTLFIKDFRP